MHMSGLTRRIFLMGAASLLISQLSWAGPYVAPEQPTAIWRGEWKDAKRDRQVPVKIFYPTGPGPFPVVLFSHGLGGARENYTYLGEYWAKHGFVVLHFQHIGSDDAVWRGAGGIAALRQAATPLNAVNRARDVSFAIDQLETLNKDTAWPLHGKLDLAHIGMAGHSFGANTTLMVSGQKLGGQTFTDKRISCAIPLSSPPPALKNYDVIYGGIKIPMLHMTGTKDVSQIDRRGFDPLERRLPFDNTKGADSYLVTFEGGDHMVFSGQRRGEPVASDARNHVLIQESTNAFWDAYLKSDKKALSWLQNDFKAELGTSGVFEQKKAN
ncbi:acetylhydrolase [bacterium]|nr:MAG: acetylhydrolase [bacterium]